MKKTILISLITYHLSLITLSSSAAVPLRWTVETSRATPAQFEAYHGETLTLEADLQSDGKPLALSGIARLFWQTNGMGSAYWEATAAVNSNRLSAVWTPEMDVGARVYNCFLGQPGTIYHAAFQLRLRPSPGALPNVLPLPVPVIDFSKVLVLNPPWGSGGGGGVNTNAVIDIANATIETNDTVKALSSSVTTLSSSVASLQSTKLDGPTDPTLSISGKAADALKVKEALAGKLSLSGGTVTGEININTETGSERIRLASNSGVIWHRGNTIEVWEDGSDARPPDATLHYPTKTINGEAIQNGTFAVRDDIPEPYTPPPYLRVYDEVRQCWWLGKMVNGVINWEVE